VLQDGLVEVLVVADGAPGDEGSAGNRAGESSSARAAGSVGGLAILVGGR
jgi:hypothetical protein